MKSESLKSIERDVFKAFPPVDPPEMVSLTPESDQEYVKLGSSFQGVKWWEAGTELIDNHFDCLPLFSPNAFHYYLPAFILRSLEAFSSDNKTLEYTIYSLSPTKTAKSDSWFLARLDQFTHEQKAVIRSFLIGILCEDGMYSLYRDAERGLKKFWV